MLAEWTGAVALTSRVPEERPAMIRTKQVTQAAATDDGPRVWVEPVGLCRDFREWCSVDVVVSDVAPPLVLWEWFQQSPAERYVGFRRAYKRYLRTGPMRRALEKLAAAGATSYLTLLY